MEPYDKNDTKKWKVKKGFRKRNPSSSPNFQVESMKNKIKQVKQPNRKKINIKKVEPLVDVLDAPMVESDSEDEDDNKEENEKGFIKDDDNTKVLREGITGVGEGKRNSPEANFTDDMYYSGKDNIYEGGGDGICAKTKGTLSYWFDNLFRRVDEYMYELACKLLETDNKNEDEVHDTHLVKNYMYYFITIIIALIATVNWFLVMFYRDPENNGKRVEYSDGTYSNLKEGNDVKSNLYNFKLLTEKYLEEKSTSSSYGSSIFSLLHILLRFPLIISDLIFRMLIHVPPKIDPIIPYWSIYILLFMALLVVVYFSPILFHKVIKHAFELNWDYTPLKFILGILFFAYVLSWFGYIRNMDAIGVAKATLTLSNIITAIAMTFLQILFVIYIFVAGPVLLCIITMCTLLYISFTPLISLPKYPKETPWSLFIKMMKLIHNQYEKSVAVEPINSSEPAVNTASHADGIKYFAISFLYTIYKYIHVIPFLILFFIAGADYFTNMRSIRLKAKSISGVGIGLFVMTLVPMILHTLAPRVFDVFNPLIRNIDLQSSDYKIDENYNIEDIVNRVLSSKQNK